MAWPSEDRKAHVERMTQRRAFMQQRDTTALRLYRSAMTYAQVAARMGVSDKAVRAMVARAVKQEHGL